MNKFCNLKVCELKEILREIQLKGRSKLKTKVEMINALVENDKTNPKPETKLDLRNKQSSKIIDKKFYEENIEIFTFKNKKSENDIYNNIREKIIFFLLKNYNNHVDLEKESSIELFQNFSILLKSNDIRNLIEIKHIGGRSNNDYYLKYTDRNDQIKEMDLEYKNGTLRIDNIPQFLQIYTNNKNIKVVNEDYHKFYYDKYLDKIIDFINEKEEEILIKPTYDIYLKFLNETKKDCFQKILYGFYKKYKDDINEIVKDSIKNYLIIYAKNENINFGQINEKLLEQKSKSYLLQDKGNFKLENISKYMEIKSFLKVKNDNSLVFNTIYDQAKIIFLLRWKNGNGCRGPAWQISLKFQ
jgi:hypothetical protein